MSAPLTPAARLGKLALALKLLCSAASSAAWLAPRLASSGARQAAAVGTSTMLGAAACGGAARRVCVDIECGGMQAGSWPGSWRAVGRRRVTAAAAGPPHLLAGHGALQRLRKGGGKLAACAACGRGGGGQALLQQLARARAAGQQRLAQHQHADGAAAQAQLRCDAVGRAGGALQYDGRRARRRQHADGGAVGGAGAAAALRRRRVQHRLEAAGGAGQQALAGVGACGSARRGPVGSGLAGGRKQMHHAAWRWRLPCSAHLGRCGT
jgi:hypothetical protein